MFDILTGDHLRRVRHWVGGSGSRMIWRILIMMMMMMMMMMMVGGSQSTDLMSGDGVMINYRKTYI